MTSDEPTPPQPAPGRYSRQLAADGWGRELQDRVAAARVLVIGVGALGSAAATHLASAGVAQLGVVDGGEVAVDDLHGAALYLTPDIGTPKAEVAAAKLGMLNPDVLVEPYPVPLTEANAAAIAIGATVVLDCTSDPEARLTLNDACCAEGVPMVVAGVAELDGFAMAVRPGESACWRCLVEHSPKFVEGLHGTRDSGPGALCGAVGSVQALVALQIAGGTTGVGAGRLVQIDGYSLEQTISDVAREPGCAACAAAAPAPQSQG